MLRFSRFSVKIRRFWIEYGHFFRVSVSFINKKINCFKCLFLDHIQGEEIQNYSIGISGGNWYDASPVKSDLKIFRCFRCEKQFKEDYRPRPDQFVCPCPDLNEQLTLPLVYPMPTTAVLQGQFSGANNVPCITTTNTTGPLTAGQYVYDTRKQTYNYWNGENLIPPQSVTYDPVRDGYVFKIGGESRFVSKLELEVHCDDFR